MANGADIAKAYIQIIPSADGIKGSLEQVMGGEAESAGKKTGGKFSKFFGGALKTGGAVVAGMTAANTALTRSFVAGANATAEYGDNIDKMSQKLGLSYGAFQRWDYVLSQSGADINSMSTGMKTLTNKLDDARNGSESAQAMFEALGLSMEDLSSMSREDVFESVIYGFQGMEDSAERAALANDLFGRSGQELTPLFNTTTEETKAMMQAAQDLGMVMSDDAVKASAEYQDSLDTLQRTLSGAKNAMMADFIPAMTQVMDGLTALFSGDSSGVGMITEGIRSFADQITAALPDLINVGAEILLSLTEAIVQNLPVLLTAAVQAIETITAGLLQPENIVLLVNAAIDTIIAITDGIIQALPLIIDAMTTVIVTMCDRLSNPDSIHRLLKAAWEIIKALAKGLWDAFPQIVSSLGQVFNGIMQVLGEWLGKMLQKGKELVGKIGEGLRSGIESIKTIGSNIVRGIWNGISSGLGWIKDKIRGWVGNVMSFLKNLFGIASPSKWAENEIGLNIARGIGVGFEDGMDDVTKMMAATLPGMTMTLGTSALKTAPAYNYGGVTIQILGREKDADTLARELQAALERRTAVWA